jgi:anti-sigma regulatory factor (Ser/Thr protein kinase)
MTTLALPRLDRHVTKQPAPLAIKRRKFRRDEHAPEAARNFTTAVLTAADINGDTVEVAKLLVSELVTNAYVNADRGQIRIAIHLGDRQVLIVVTDAGRRRAALPTEVPDDDSEHGRGWMLIEGLAADSGIERIAGGNGHRAWFQLDLPGGAS